MANEQVKQVLQSTQQLHERARSYFAHLAHQSKQPRVKLLLDYLAGHEAHLAETIRGYKQDAAQKVLDTWVSSVDPVTHLADEFDWDIASRTDCSFDELVEFGLGVDNRIVDVYRELARRAEPPWLQDIFQSLYDLEVQEEKQMAKQTLRGMDL